MKYKNNEQMHRKTEQQQTKLTNINEQLKHTEMLIFTAILYHTQKTVFKMNEQMFAQFLTSYRVYACHLYISSALSLQSDKVNLLT